MQDKKKHCCFLSAMLNHVVTEVIKRKRWLKKYEKSESEF
jgi:hypothetical protein